MKLHVLVLFLLALTGCGMLSEAGPTPEARAPVAQVSPQLPTARAPASTSTTALAGATPAAPTAPPTLAPTESPTPGAPATSTPAPATAESVPVASVPSAFEPAFTYPIGMPGKPLGDGFFVRHGTQVENTWYNPGYWHTGEDWYAIEGDTAGARVYAIANGEVVYAGANYPGRVVIVRHADDLFSMYGHLDPALTVRVGQSVVRGQLISTVLRRGDQTPNHLHFEIRTFLTAREVNGSTPRYGFRCGVQCPPGPGYWPIDAPDLPSDRGWRNPTHVIARRMFQRDSGSLPAQVVVATKPVSLSVSLWSAPPGDTTQSITGELVLKPGERFSLLDIHAGAEDTRETSAQSYQLWYAIRLADGRSGWVQAAIPSTFETGADGRPSSISFNFYPAISAAP